MANVNGLRSGEFNFGIMQSDHQYKAMEGVAPFEKEGRWTTSARCSPAERSLHRTGPSQRQHQGLDDLKGKRVNIGNPGSGQRDTLEEIMKVKGWDKSVFSLAAELKPAEQASALGDNNIDAMTYFVGHPNGAIQEATTTTDAVLVPITGPEIDKLLEERSYYTKAEIPGGLYKGNDQATQSIGGKAVLSTTSGRCRSGLPAGQVGVREHRALPAPAPGLQDLKPEEMIEVGLSAPLHEGAERYYKERGWL